MKWGVLSDTHGLLRPEVLPLLSGVERILHLGDVGDASILKALRQIAPVHAVRGNVDRTGPCSKLPETDVLFFEGHYLYLLHDRSTMSLNPAAARFSAVLFGHTHRPLIEWHRSILFMNPGSCGPRRFDLPATIGHLSIGPDGLLHPEIVRIPYPTP
jgi:putative phosphoesterase